MIHHDDIDKFSMLTWSTSRYRVLRDLPTFGHIANKSRSLGNIGNVACSVTPSAIYPLKCFIAISLKNSRAKLTCIGLSFPVARPPDAGVASSFTRTYSICHCLYSTTWSPNRPVAQSLRIRIFRCPWHHFVRWTVVLLVCNMRSQDSGGLQKWWYRRLHEMLPCSGGNPDHHIWNVVKHWESKLKRDLQGRAERTLAETGDDDYHQAFGCPAKKCGKKGGGHKNVHVSKTLRCVSQRKLARKQNTGIPMRKLALWPHKWCVSGGISNSLRPYKMKLLF